jgi:hypothetical protein
MTNSNFGIIEVNLYETLMRTDVLYALKLP